MNTKSENIYLNTPFNEKDIVKSLGARWDMTRKQWCVLPDANLELFEKWLPKSQTELTVKPENRATEHDLNAKISKARPCEADLCLVQGVTLGELLNRVSNAIFERIPGSVWLKAEISQLRTIKGDHLAIELVEHDGSGNLKARAQAFLWKGNSVAIISKFETATGGGLNAGIKVMLSVKTEFSATSGIRLIIQDIDPSYTLGDIEAKLRHIRTALSKEGVINRNRQLTSPTEFCRVAVISPDGAAGLGDFKRDADILAGAGLCLFTYLSARFQGADAALDIKNRLLSVLDTQKDDLPRYDAICIIRGGGSVTDLYWLNDLELARAVCNCPVPVLTGIGHERDNTMLDEIANRCFDTPSKVAGHIRDVICGNAHTATGHYQQIMHNARQQVAQADQANDALLSRIKADSLQQLNKAENHIDQLVAGLEPSLLRLLSETEAKLEQGMRWIESRAGLVLSNAEAQLGQYLDRIKFDGGRWLTVSYEDTGRVYQSVFQLGRQQIDLAVNQVEAMGREILGIGPQATLRRGFAIIRNQNGNPIVSAEEAQRQPLLNIEFRDGRVEAIPTNPKEKL